MEIIAEQIEKKKNHFRSVFESAGVLLFFFRGFLIFLMVTPLTGADMSFGVLVLGSLAACTGLISIDEWKLFKDFVVLMWSDMSEEDTLFNRPTVTAERGDFKGFSTERARLADSG